MTDRMIFAEFVGGPLDGKIIELAEALPDIHVPLPTLGQYLGVAEPLNLDYRTEIYQAAERRLTPTGDLMVRYRSESVR